MFVETQYFMDSTKLHHSEIKHNNEGLNFLWCKWVSLMKLKNIYTNEILTYPLP